MVWAAVPHVVRTAQNLAGDPTARDWHSPARTSPSAAGPVSAPRSFPRLKELEYKIAWFHWLLLFFFCFHSCFEFVTFYPFLPTFIYFPLPPSHTLSLLACFRCCFTGSFGCKPLSFTANSWSSQITDYRAVSSGCLLLLLRVGKIIF